MMTGQEDSKVMNPDCPVIYTSLSVSIINNSVVISHPKVYIKENTCQASCPQWIGLLVQVQKFYKAITRSLST